MVTLKKIVPPGNRLKAALSFLLPSVIIFLRPMQMTLSQSAVMGSLFLVVLWWGTGWVHKDAASAVLLAAFLLFGHTPAQQVFFFPLSENIIMIITAYLLSQGIVNSKAADRFSDFVLDRYCRNSVQMVMITFLLCALLIFIIPQPFPRVVLLAAIYINFLKSRQIKKEEEMILLFSIFVAATVTSLLFVSGDVIANYAALSIASVEMSYSAWLKYMAPPTLVVTVIVTAAFLFAFRRDLTSSFTREAAAASFTVGKDGRKALLVMSVIVVLWLTEPFHGVSAAKVAAAGTLAMFAFRIIGFKDLKVINLSLILFLTAEFSIGRVLVASGVAEIIREHLLLVLPDTGSSWFLPVIVVAVMGMHMIMGSIITALSFSIPMLIVVTAGAFPPEFIALLVLVSVSFHYVLPFHQVTIMIGFGSERFENRHVMKFGVYLTVITLASVFLLYLPWWRLTGLSL